MTACWSCGQPLKNTESLYHAGCLKKLFGRGTPPVLELTASNLAAQAVALSPQMSISGVQPKFSLRLNARKNILEPTAAGGEYILKPQTQDFPHLPENENLCMALAQEAGLNVPPHALLKLTDGTLAYVVKRFDRDKRQKIHQEDFQQILNLNVRDKYQGSYEQIGRKLRELSTAPGLDAQLFYETVLFSFIIGNGDAHTKNFSLQYLAGGERRLSPVYDLVSSRLVIPGEKSEMALTLNSRQNNIREKDFQSLADYLKIPRSAPVNRALAYLEKFTALINNNNTLSRNYKTALSNIMRERVSRFTSQERR
ncbi:MAG: HipA domain-containing protein [Candidatus Margulisbacteria bacterium]|jgi:serine/threonine-protein kinase HipA|nr:HipA domain-containing protein [Candidatus Margulisiibacteriota bacterium]